MPGLCGVNRKKLLSGYQAPISSVYRANASSGEQGTRSEATTRDVMALSSGLTESASGAAAVSTGGEGPPQAASKESAAMLAASERDGFMTGPRMRRFPRAA